jgi:hypothetical protein
MTEVQPKDIHPGQHQTPEHIGRRAGRANGRDDLGLPVAPEDRSFDLAV